MANKFRIYGTDSAEEIIEKINIFLNEHNVIIVSYTEYDGDRDGYDTFEIKTIK